MSEEEDAKENGNMGQATEFQSLQLPENSSNKSEKISHLQLQNNYYYYYYTVKINVQASPERMTLMQLKNKCLYKCGYKKFSFELPLEILEWSCLACSQR